MKSSWCQQAMVSLLQHEINIAFCLVLKLNLIISISYYGFRGVLNSYIERVFCSIYEWWEHDFWDFKVMVKGKK